MAKTLALKLRRYGDILGEASVSEAAGADTNIRCVRHIHGVDRSNLQKSAAFDTPRPGPPNRSRTRRAGEVDR